MGTQPEPKEVADHLIVTIADHIGDGHKVITGLNSHVPLLAVAVAKIIQGKRVSLYTVAEAFDPDLESVKLKPSTGDAALAENATVLPMIEAFDLVQKGEIDVMFLGPVQIDEETNINLSVIGSYQRPKVRLPGGAASAFIVPLVKRVYFWRTKHTPRDLVKRVDFVTATARLSRNEVYLFTNLCVFNYDRGTAKWVLKSRHPWADPDQIRTNTGFEYVTQDDRVTRSPNQEERELIRALDPNDLRLRAFM
ncbi:MAG: CoA-transferase subunit beta [Thaumarchaeota archaeon]|nr:CoA-transferase subunit beta [Candidatus Calditenuaceae archaeon]MDW8041948.1 CoA-transferase [Nitrososphaerota archaeon]